MIAELFTSHAIKPKRIAIIGGGIASATLADHIFETAPDTHVTLFCKDSELASRGSGNKQGAIYPLLQGSESNLAQFYATSYDYALSYYKSWIDKGLKFEHGFTGVLQQAIKPELEGRLLKVAQTWPSHCQFLTTEESNEIAGVSLGFPSIYFKKAGWIFPQEFCQRLINTLTNKFSLQLVLNTKVTQVEKSKLGWQLSNENNTQLGTFDAVVICTGHLSNEFSLSNHIPLQSVRGQVSHLNNKTELTKLKTVLCHKGYITPSQGEHQCFGATFIKNSNDETVKQEEQLSNLTQIKHVYKAQAWASDLNQGDIIADKAAIRAMSPDHIPIVGELFTNQWILNNVDKNTGKLRRLMGKDDNYQASEAAGLFIMTGLGARGLTSAPLLAKHLTHCLFGKNKVLTDTLEKAVSASRYQIKHLKKHKSL